MSPDLARNDFWLVLKIKSALKGRRCQDTEDDGTEDYSTTGVPKMFPTVAASLGEVHSCSEGPIRRLFHSVSSKYTATFAIKSFRELHSHRSYFYHTKSPDNLFYFIQIES
jgi:hypothetical protein